MSLINWVGLRQKGAPPQSLHKHANLLLHKLHLFKKKFKDDISSPFSPKLGNCSNFKIKNIKNGISCKQLMKASVFQM